MTYATVMVSLALDQPNNARLEVAGELAERFEADIVGIAAARFAPPLYFTDGIAAQRLIDQEEGSVKRRLADLEAQFRAATRTRSARAEWRSAMDFPARYVLAQARCADIIVSGALAKAVAPTEAMASSIRRRRDRLNQPNPHLCPSIPIPTRSRPRMGAVVSRDRC